MLFYNNKTQNGSISALLANTTTILLILHTGVGGVISFNFFTRWDYKKKLVYNLNYYVTLFLKSFKNDFNLKDKITSKKFEKPKL